MSGKDSTEDPKKSAHMIQQDKDPGIVELEAELHRLKMALKERETRDKQNPEAGRVPRPGARDGVSRERYRHSRERRGYSQGNRGRCYFCESRDHMVRECPHKAAWMKKHKSKSDDELN